MTLPLRVHAATAQVLTEQALVLDLPLWLPWPLPPGWLVTGLGWVGDTQTQRATVLACSGPNPVGGDADLLLVAEEPGTGLGGGYAGLDSPHPGAEVGDGPPHARIGADGHQVSMWWVSSAAPDRAVYAGEAGGRWLWLILHPESAGTLMMERLSLADVRALGHEVELLAYGALSSRLRPS